MRMESNTKEAKERMQRAVDRYLEEAGKHLEGEAKKAIEADPRRVDTGLLRNSITFAVYGRQANISSYTSDATDKNGDPVDPIEEGGYVGLAPGESEGKAVYIGTNVEYAMYVHEGTSKMAPNRFIKNAIEWNRQQLKTMAESIIGRGMKFS